MKQPCKNVGSRSQKASVPAFSNASAQVTLDKCGRHMLLPAVNPWAEARRIPSWVIHEGLLRTSKVGRWVRDLPRRENKLGLARIYIWTSTEKNKMEKTSKKPGMKKGPAQGEQPCRSVQPKGNKTPLQALLTQDWRERGGGDKEGI